MCLSEVYRSSQKELSDYKHLAYLDKNYLAKNYLHH